MGKKHKRNGKKGRSTIDWGRIRWGTLTDWCKRHNSQVKRYTGKDCFTKNGELNDNTLRYLYNHDEVVKRIAKSHWKRILRKIQFKLHVLRG